MRKTISGTLKITFMIHAIVGIVIGLGFLLIPAQLGSTIFQPFSHITKIFPEKVLGVYEQKWYNQGKFVTEHSTEKAVTIYETVNW